MNDISKLLSVVRHLHECEASHTGTSTVKETMDGKTVREGQVEEFALTGHSKAEKAYAWSYRDDNDRIQYVSVLEIPPVSSPRDAVQVAIAGGKA